MGSGRRRSAKRQGGQPSTGIGRAVFEGARGNTPQHTHTLHATVEGAHSEGSWLRTLTRRSVRRWPREINASQELVYCPEKASVQPDYERRTYERNRTIRCPCLRQRGRR